VSYILYTSIGIPTYKYSINVYVFGLHDIVVSVKKSLKYCDQEWLKEKEKKTIIYGPLRFWEGYWDGCTKIKGMKQIQKYKIFYRF